MATILLTIDVNAKIVQEILGHANISMNPGVCGHVLPSMQRDAMDGMDDIFRGKNRDFERFHILLEFNIVDKLKIGLDSPTIRQRCSRPAFKI